MEHIQNVDLDLLRKGVLLAIRGGGVRSSASIGVLRALEEANIPIKSVSGESGGSLVAGLLACGFKSKEILQYFLQYNETITKAAKIYGGKGAMVIEEVINEITGNILMGDLSLDCWINACQGNLLKPKLYLFSKKDTPKDTLGFACSASAGLPIFYGSSHKEIDGKKITLFDGGLLHNPYIPPDIKQPIIYASFLNGINYQRFIPFLQRPADAAMARAYVVVPVPVGKYIVTGNNDAIKEMEEAGYQLTKKILNVKN